VVSHGQLEEAAAKNPVPRWLLRALVAIATR
jgi:hypothetical protein